MFFDFRKSVLTTKPGTPTNVATQPPFAPLR